MRVTSGTRNAGAQARAMYDKFAAGASGSDYANQQAMRQIRQAYRDGMANGQTRDQIIANMTAVIENQVNRGIYISPHMTGRGADIRTRDLSPDERQRLEQIVRDEGGTPLPEGRPPHLHIQFPR
jgi:hypothetical protein